jgi:esterase/lipase superfamily enzyme
MLRTAGLMLVWMAAVLANCLVFAQEPSGERRPPRIQVIKPREKTGTDWRIDLPLPRGAKTIPADPPQRATDRARESARARAPIGQSSPAASLADFDARRPFGYSARGNYLVAAVRDGDGLALWETANHRRLRRLENSDRPYALLAIADEAQWIAAVRQDNHEQIDLWRGDNGRHVRVIRAAGGPKSGLEFQSDNRLSVTAANGDGLVYSVPSGVAVGGLGSAGGGSAAKPPRLRFEGPKAAVPSAPSTTRTAPPTLPGHSADREEPPTARRAPRSERIAEPRIPATKSPRIGAQRMAPPAMSAPRMAAPPRETEFQPAPPVDDQPRSAAPDRPTFAAPASPAEPSSAAPDDPAGGSAPEPADELPADEAPATPGAAAPDEPAREFRIELDEEPEETRSPGSASDDPAGGSAPESVEEEPAEEMSADEAPTDETPAEEAEIAPGAAAPAPPARRFRFEMGEEATRETSEESEPPAEPTAAAPPATTAAPPVAPRVEPAVEAPRPTSVNIHYATNRNRLAPKDREWLVYFGGFFGSLPAFIIYGLVILALLIFPWIGKRSWAASAVLVGSVLLCGMGLLEAYVRSQLRDELSGEMYGCRPTDLAYGACEISVPPAANRKAGDLSRPVSVWVFEAPENPEKHFMLRHVTEHKDKAAFYESLSAQLGKSDARAAMLFIHGYNVSFEDAIFRTAQLAVDLKFPGAPIAFCWPSYADPVKYTFDEQNAEVSIPALREVLDDLATRSGAKRIHIIAHSMGNRVLAGALRNMDPAAQTRNKRVFRELVLAAPDIDSRVFQSQVLPHIVRNTQHCTLYASSRDRALLMSRCFHNYQRLGETQPELVVANGLDTIDASLVDTSLLGHSYIGDVQSIVSDLHDLVVSGKRPTERLGLEASVRNALKYWSIKPELQTATDASLRR